MKRRDVPNNRRTVKCKWVFNVKRNGVYRARLVACGYSQIAGVDFVENYAPVVNDVSYRIMLVLMLLLKLDGKVVDVETAFLHGTLEEDIYMDSPKGLGEYLEEEIGDDECVQLLKSIYGLVQAARQWWKKLTDILRKIGFTGGDVDPCLMMYNGSMGRVFIALYVDDCLCIGKENDINRIIEAIQKAGLSLKIEDNLKDYLSCSIVLSSDRKKAWLGQPSLMKNLEKRFGAMVKENQMYLTPGTPHLRITREIQQPLSKEDQKMYRSGVGMLLYLVKHSRPDLANCVRELTKNMDKASEAALKEMKRVIKYVLDTAEYGLRMYPVMDNDKWTIETYTDSDYAGDADNRISVTGYVIYLCEVPIMWKSKGQRSVALSSSEAEYVALSEAAKEIKFVAQLLMNVGINVDLPIIVRIDNVGAIFMSENVTTGGRTKHVDIRYHFVREFVYDGFIRIKFVKSEDNDADIFTKNVTGELLHKHKRKMIWTREQMSNE